MIRIEEKANRDNYNNYNSNSNNSTIEDEFIGEMAAVCALTCWSPICLVRVKLLGQLKARVLS
jgi:hypothetical protein